MTKLPKAVYPVKKITALFSCLNLSVYSTNPYFSCFLVFVIFTRDHSNEIYRYVNRIGLCIDWKCSSISFKGSLRILSYLGWSLIIVWFWFGNNSLNIICIFHILFQFVLSFHVILNLYIPHYFEWLIFWCRPAQFFFSWYPFNHDFLA